MISPSCILGALCCIFLLSEVSAQYDRRCYSEQDCPPRTCCFLARRGKRSLYPGNSEWNFPFNTCVGDQGTNEACYVFGNGREGCPGCKIGLRCVRLNPPVFDPPYGFRGRCRLPTAYKS